MIFRNSTLIFLIILVLIGCQGRRVEVVLNENIKLFKTFPKEDSVFFKNMKELKGITPSQIHKVDSTLILFNFSRKKNGYCFFNFSLKKNELSKGYLSYGRGPNEVIGPFGSMVKDGKLWMYDVTTKKLMSTDLKKALNDSDTPFKSFPIEKDHYQIAPLDSISFFSVGESTSLSKIQLYDLNTQKTLKEYGKFILLDEEAPIDAIKDGYRSLMATKPIGNKILLAYRYEDIIEIYDLNSGLNKAVHGPDQIVLDFIPTKIHTSRHVFMTTKDTRRAYARPTVTNKYIYIPYSGQRKGSKSHEERFKWNYQNVIHVFDWDGNPIKRLLLNDYVSSIAISEDDKILYAFNPETGYLIKANLN